MTNLENELFFPDGKFGIFYTKDEIMINPHSQTHISDPVMSKVTLK